MAHVQLQDLTLRVIGVAKLRFPGWVIVSVAGAGTEGLGLSQDAFAQVASLSPKALARKEASTKITCWIVHGTDSWLLCVRLSLYRNGL